MSILKKPPFKLLSQQLEKISYLHGIKNDIQKNNEVSKLQEKTDFILSMYVVYLIAAWESYIEAMVKKGVDVLLNHGNDPGIFTYKVLLRVSAKLAESKDKREIWKIAGQGWKEQMEEHVRNEVEKFHSPRPDKIDSLFEATLGLKSVSASWIWDGEDNESVKKKLKQIIDIRGSIAHGIYPEIGSVLRLSLRPKSR